MEKRSRKKMNIGENKEKKEELDGALLENKEFDGERMSGGNG